MSNQQNRNKNNGFNGSEYSYDELLEGCNDTLVTLNRSGAVYLETTTHLSDKIAEVIENSFGISEIGRVFIDIKADKETCRILSAKVLLCFVPGTGGPNGHITKYGSGKGDGGRVRTLLDTIPAANSTGTYELSDTFKKVVGSLLPDDVVDQKEFPIYEHPKNSKVACVEVDIDAVMSLLLKAEENLPYTCNLLFAEQIDTRDGMAEYSVIFTKCIDISKKRSKRKKNNNINYTSIGESFANDDHGNRGRNNNNHNRNNNRGRRY